MISRHIPQKPENDNYRRLANYIADASHKGEKALMSWCAGCWAEDDYQLAIHEVEAVQAMNTRSGKEKTYHLVISFRPEDEAKLSPEVFKEIEMEFANALGYEEHQRHCGVHKNTANIHLHIAYCQIHPERRTRHEPFRDFAIRDRLCRQLEKRYSLTPDNGRDPEQRVPKNDRAISFESRTGQESLFGYAQRHKTAIIHALSEAKTWVDCHRVFHKFGLAIQPHGNGIVLRDLKGGHCIKASNLDRSFSKRKLEKRFGKFVAQSVDSTQVVAPEFTYAAKPIHQDAERDNLYADFCRSRDERRKEMAKIKEREDRLYKNLRQRWDKKWQEIKRLPMMRSDRQEVRRKFDVKKKAELAGFRAVVKEDKDAVRKRYPFTCWNQFLQHQAGQGNESALAMLRSRKSKSSTQSQPHYISVNNGSGLKVVSQMREILAGEATTVQKTSEAKYHIDGKGTVIFNLPGGVTICDNGHELYFTANSEKAAGLAAKLAQARWGQEVTVQGNVISKKKLGYQREHQEAARPSKGFER